MPVNNKIYTCQEIQQGMCLLPYWSVPFATPWSQGCKGNQHAYDNLPSHQKVILVSVYQACMGNRQSLIFQNHYAQTTSRSRSPSLFLWILWIKILHILDVTFSPSFFTGKAFCSSPNKHPTKTNEKGTKIQIHSLWFGFLILHLFRHLKVYWLNLPYNLKQQKSISPLLTSKIHVK